MIRIKDVEPLTLEKIPEIWEAYKKENFDIPQDPREDWIEKLDNAPETDYSVPFEEREDDIRLGSTIVFDNLVAWFVLELVQNSNTQRLNELFDWFEELASDENTKIKTHILGVTICESFVSNHRAYFPELFPFIEKRPNFFNELKDASKRFRLSEEVKALLDSV